MSISTRTARIVPETPVTSIEEYAGQGGGQALAAAFSMPREEIVAVVKRSGLRGRGGAGFPTGVKWGGLLAEAAAVKYFCCNAAEGEPGTFKDRFLIRRNPYRLVEGVAIGAHATGATAAFIGLKARFEQEAALLGKAIAQMESAGLLGDIHVELRLGPDEYLFGEERALLEVIEGREPMPRVLPPYMQGIFATPEGHYPAAVNNAETLVNVPLILLNGPEWFREAGTEKSPGTMVFTLVGDVRRPGVYELPLGTPLSTLLHEVGGGPHEGRELKAVLSGASHPVLTPAHFDTPMDFDSLAETGAGLGSAGFVVYDDTACMVKVARAFSRFLSVESCGQCNPCKIEGLKITDVLGRIDGGEGSEGDVEQIMRSCRTVTDGQRCYVPTAHSFLVQSIVRIFVGELAAHLEHGCPFEREIELPKIVDFDEETGTFTLDEHYRLKRADWTYEDGE